MPLPDLPAAQTAIIELTNAFRAEQRLGGLQRNATLALAAQRYADYLAASGRFAHDADGRSPADRITAAGYKHCAIAENLALNQKSTGFETRELARSAVEGWKGSPPHRRAMLDPGVTEIGIGIAKAPDADPKYISVQLFGRPLSMRYSFRIENAAPDAVAYRFGNQDHTVPPRAIVTITSCNPGDILFPAAKPVSTFAAREGGVYRALRDSAGVLRIEVNVAATIEGTAPKSR